MSRPAIAKAATEFQAPTAAVGLSAAARAGSGRLPDRPAPEHAGG
ncbi:hypothetical protein [Planomonospora sp. ID91781]|nr:hypothetical protein [Planomonospora sp. ID91781]